MKLLAARYLACIALSLPAVSLKAAEPTPAVNKTPEANADAKGQWVPILEGTGGVTVDRTNGDVFVVVTGKEIFKKETSQGIWKSTDQGATFMRVDGEVVGGRCETAYGLCADPNGRRVYCFMLDGPSGYTLDGGKTWEKIAKQNRGWDFAAVDWSIDKPQVIFGAEHESGGRYHLSTDGGKSWTQLGVAPKDARSTFGVGVVDAHTLLRWMGSVGGLERSVDAGVTWTRVSDEQPLSHVMTVFHGVCYWVGPKGLLVSKDNGATWSLQGQPMPAAWGPYFGKDENQIVVAGKDGIHETTDGGQSWSLVAPLPDLLKNPPSPGWFLNLAFDPVHNIFYASWMGRPAFRFRR